MTGDDSDLPSRLVQASLRSKSADSIRNRTIEDATDELSEQALKKLNAVLSIGTSAPQHQHQQPLEGRKRTTRRQRSLGESSVSSVTSESSVENRSQTKLADQFNSEESDCSVSTAAPDDDVSEHGNLSRRGSIATDGGAKVSDIARVREDLSHKCVPRNHNLAEMHKSNSKETATTMMIRNLPTWYSQKDLLMELAELGFTGTFDFLYIPVDRATSASVGYAFVNFIDTAWTNQCMQALKHYRFQRRGRGSSKKPSVSLAHIQGLENNLRHYENTAVNACKFSTRRPLVMANISKMSD